VDKEKINKPTGVIGKTIEEGLPVIWSFENIIPPELERDNLTWLTVISWSYEGGERNGMPPELTNQKMLALEDALDKLESPAQCVSAYRRTGNNLKEFVYYIHDREMFLDSLNSVLQTHEHYPIEINFYEDKEWSDFRKLQADFADA